MRRQVARLHEVEEAGRHAEQGAAGGDEPGVDEEAKSGEDTGGYLFMLVGSDEVREGGKEWSVG